MANPRVFNIPASAPFLPTLIKAMVEGRLIPGFPAAGDPLALAQATLYLPTRRACRLARDRFLAVTGGNAAILPRIVALGDIDEDEIAFAEAGSGDANAMLDLPPALGGLERRLLLAQLVIKWTKEIEPQDGSPLVAHTPAAALALADDLARLMDDITTRQVSWDKLDGLVPDHLDVFWQLTLKFLRIARQAWPELLAERGAIEPARRRDLLIAAEQARLATSNAPVIAAGSTGSMPATAALLATIAKLPHGAVVLPGLDTDLDQASWQIIAGGDGAPAHDGGMPAFGHPQFGMQALLARIGIARAAVATLAPAAAYGREAFVSQALRPSASTEHWRSWLAQPAMAARADAAVASLAVIEAANAEEEALAIAMALRETLEHETKTAALVTPDRALARRVAAALERWKVPFDDSGGDNLADTAAGLFARLAAETPLGGLAPVTLLGLLKHQLFALGGGEHGRAVSALERAVLRGPRPRAGTAGLAHALATFRETRGKLHRNDPRSAIAEADLDAAADLVNRLTKALAPLETLPSGRQPFAAIAARHRDVVAALSADAKAESAAFVGAGGVALANALDELAESSAARLIEVAPGDYPELFHAALADRVVRRPGALGVRVRIFGPLEARLQNIDRMVLGGLVEGTWPPETRSDAWLSRPMRLELGLDLPERRIGLSAHDFAQALGAKEVILTRPAKLAGAPTVMSRFVQRLAALAGETRWQGAGARGAEYLAWARRIDRHPGAPKPAARPQPAPPREARPLRLSVTEIEHWLRDPYTIYAKHVLRLFPFDAVDTPPGVRDRGTVIHEAIGDFTKEFAAALPPDPVAKLVGLGAKHFATLEDFPEARAFWWPRFLRIADWFAGWEFERRRRINALYAEIDGKLEISLGERTFVLSTRADRIERLTSGGYAILDYKTGAARTEKQVRTGLAPQLTLEAAILRGGGFTPIAAGGSVAEIAYVTLKGGEPAGEPKEIEFKDGTPDQQADYALKRLREIAVRFENESEPYRSLVSPMWATRYGDYDHLARVKEWSATGGAGEDGDR